MKKQLSFIWMSLLLVLAACSDGLDNIEYNSDSGITVAAPEVTETTGTSLTLTASATGNVGDIVRRGFCYSANAQTPTISDNVVDADENFSASISGLMGSTTYYVRAFVYGNSRYTYSDPVEATTGAMSLDEQLANYVAPAYPDDYSSIADWTNRSQWNLSNVHDPTVVLADDGYYYMYQTDASYGNAHTAGGHFHGRRSKNLVDWEEVGTAFTDTTRPDFVDNNPEGKKAALWAPDIHFVKGKYLLTYSLAEWGNHWISTIGYAVADSPEGPFTPKGKIFNSRDVDVENSIDQFVYEEAGRYYILWGSFFGIYICYTYFSFCYLIKLAEF